MKVWIGKVINTKNKKTAIVQVERLFTHPVYEKKIKRIKRYHVHDEVGVKEGDVVRFAETRPLSKTKRWKIMEVAGKEKVPKVSPARNATHSVADGKVSKAEERGENQRKKARKSAKNQRLATERSQR